MADSDYTGLGPTGRVCVRCVMDQSDSAIQFDEQGICNHCLSFERDTRPKWHPDRQGEDLWRAAVTRLKRNRRTNDYDCAIGLSGGLDSSQLVILAAEAGLNPLIVHVDAGWNSELAVRNIEKVLDATGFDLFTRVVDWDSMRELQLAYLRSGVMNQDVPQDHAFIAGLFSVAKGFGIRDVISGHNIATESVLPRSWSFSPMDTTNLKAIYKRFGGESDLEGYPLLPVSTWLRVNSPFPLFNFIQPLDWHPYDKEQSEAQLGRIGWRPYPRKHGESRFTVFFQEHILPTRFGVDKRRAHYSSLILAGQMSREVAVRLLQQPMLTSAQLALERNFFCRKMEISEDEFERLMLLPRRSHFDLANTTRSLDWARRFASMVRRK